MLIRYALILLVACLWLQNRFPLLGGKLYLLSCVFNPKTGSHISETGFKPKGDNNTNYLVVFKIKKTPYLRGKKCAFKNAGNSELALMAFCPSTICSKNQQYIIIVDRNVAIKALPRQLSKKPPVWKSLQQQESHTQHQTVVGGIPHKWAGNIPRLVH